MEDRIFTSQLSLENWESKYRYDNETPLETQIRIAKALASVEPNDKKHWEEVFLKTLVKFDKEGNAIGLKCTPGGRITANLGTKYKNASLFNCYISGPVRNATITYERRVLGTNVCIPVKYTSPETGDNMTNICLTLLEQALTLGSEGGWGINASFIRPRGSIVKGVGVEHPGVIKFLEIFDKMSEVIVAGNNDGYVAPLKNHITIEQLEKIKKIYSGPLKKQARKGAMMVCMDVSHPDIEEFILAKQKGGTLTKFNASVLITDEFLEKVQKDEFFELKFNDTIYKVVRAVELYDLIMRATYHRNEPGVLFYDNMQKNNPIEYLGPVNATNPCGEIPGNAITTTACLLGSINVTQYIRPDRTFDWESYRNDIAIFTRMLDNINDLHNNDLPAYLWSIKNIRQIGMGVNGFGSMLYMMGIPYNSTEAIEIAMELSRIKLETCLDASALLAAEKGAAPAFCGLYFKTPYWREFLKGKLNPQVRDRIHKFGLRNLKLTTSPPLGNSSIMCNITSNGIEPVFLHSYDRSYIAASWPEGIDQNNIKSILKQIKIGDVICWEGMYRGKFYYYEPHNRGLCIKEKVKDFGYQWVEENFPNDLTEVVFKEEKSPYVTTDNLTVEDHLNIQQAFQMYVDQSISKTTNLPNNYPFEDFKNLYLNAWKRGLIGITTYRDGTMESVLSKIEETKQDLDRHIVKNVRLPKKFQNGPCEIIKREGMKFYIHFSYLEEDKEMKFPIAIWLQTNHPFKGEAIYVNRALKALQELLLKNGIEQIYIDKLLDKSKDDTPNLKLAKHISMCLRHNLAIVDIINSLENIEGDNVSTLLTALRKFLSKHIEDGTKAIGKVCDNLKCKSSNLIYESGCVKCLDCGASGCG